MSGTLDFIEELGIGQEPSVEDTDLLQEENTEPNNSTKEESLSLDSGTEPEIENEKSSKDTEPKNEDLVELKKMIEGMEKRIADKDEYIAKLREESQAKELGSEEDSVDNDIDDDDFWENPKEYIKRIKEEFAQQTRLQQLQIQENAYSSTVENYWKTVNRTDLQEAVATDLEFAETFNNSSEPYKVAYEYLSAKKEQKNKSEQSLRDKIREEERQKILQEMKKGSNKETIPSMKTIGSNSSSSSKEISEDGFASFFGSDF